MDPEPLSWNEIEWVPKTAFDAIGNELRTIRRLTMTTDAQISDHDE